MSTIFFIILLIYSRQSRRRCVSRFFSTEREKERERKKEREKKKKCNRERVILKSAEGGGSDFLANAIFFPPSCHKTSKLRNFVYERDSNSRLDECLR